MRCCVRPRSRADGSRARPAASSGRHARCHDEPATTAADMILAVENLSKAFQGLQALAPLSFAIENGITAFIGPNGAGKTTLFNLLSGIEGPSSGAIRHRSEDITSLSVAERARRGIQRTFQNLQIFFRMSAIENVMVGASPRLRMGLLSSLLSAPAIRRETREIRERAAALMAEVGLSDFIGHAADALPYGALKRLELARALAADPEILMLDEPAAGLNPRETAEIDEVIRRIVDRGIAVLLVEHDMKLVM
ncbi:MAG: ATP-binding cassette domain-containing protein, partial [Alphaproteobacteria bacterium]